MRNTEQAIESARQSGGRELRLSQGLEEVPASILELADTLEVLDLAGNRLSTLPDWIAELPRLRILFLSGNAFEEIPAALSRCRALRMLALRDNRVARWDEDALPESLVWLVLTGNRLSSLPASIGRMRGLRKLMLAGNRLESLPDEMAGCQGLELLRLSANRLQTLPDWLADLPRLAWLAYAGNPGTPAFAADAPPGLVRPRADASHSDIACLPTGLGARLSASGEGFASFAWDDLEIGDRLGEGASGVIVRAAPKAPDAQDRGPEGELAIKVFKSGMTSDGFPADERSACIAAGRHPHVVPVVGEVSGHPEGRPALALGLVPGDHVRLGGPPDFETCTRDTFDPSASFDIATILRIARAIASAGAHLHARGILHGDLYAHNILFSPKGGVLLGDFGAASPLPRDGAAWAERLEIRAYGCLLDDLLVRRTPAAAIQDRSLDAATLLETLRGRCLDPRPDARPRFAEILQVLAED